MNNMIRAEMFKLKKDKSFKVCLITCLGVCTFMILSLFLVNNIIKNLDPYTLNSFSNSSGVTINIPSGENTTDINDIYDIEFPTTYIAPIHSLWGDSNLFVIFFSILAGTYIAAEFDRGTVRNNVTRIKNKSSFYMGKLFSQLVSVLIMCVLSTVLFSVLYYIFIGFDGILPSFSNIITITSYILLKMLYIFAYSSIFVMIAFLLRSVGATIGASMGFIVLETTVIQLLKLFNNNIINTIINIFPSKYFTELNSLIKMDGTFRYNKLFFYIIVPVIIIAATTLIGNISFKKRDVC